MSEPEPDRDWPEAARRGTSRREVADWEYRTVYLQHFQVRFSVGLHNRLSRWAKREHKPLDVLLVDALEEAVRRRTRP